MHLRPREDRLDQTPAVAAGVAARFDEQALAGLLRFCQGGVEVGVPGHHALVVEVRVVGHGRSSRFRLLLAPVGHVYNVPERRGTLETCPTAEVVTFFSWRNVRFSF